MNDPALTELVRLTTHHKPTIIGSTVLACAAGVAFGYAGPETSTGLAVVYPAEVAPGGAVENLEVSAGRTQTLIESKVMTEALAPGTVLVATVLRDQPPSSLPVNLLSLRVTAPTSEAASTALRLAIEELRAAQDPLHDLEQARLTRNAEIYQSDIDRLSATEASKGGHEAITRAIVDLSQTARWQQRVRTHRLEVLVGPNVSKTSRTSRIVAFGAVGFVLGIGLGYLFAFVIAGLRAVRAAGT